MTSRAFRVVEMFEEAVAEYAGAAYGVAMESCSMALYLSMLYWGKQERRTRILIPARTYISVPFAIMHAGHEPVFVEGDWRGAYWLEPTYVVDSALRFRMGMYAPGTLYCVSFHARKRLNIGRGGMVLTDDAVARDWLRRGRFDGRTGSVPFLSDSIGETGWNAYMTPEQAGRGLQLLENLPPDPPDLTPDYPDLRVHPVFRTECEICGMKLGKHQPYCVKAQ